MSNLFLYILIVTGALLLQIFQQPFLQGTVLQGICQSELLGTNIEFNKSESHCVYCFETQAQQVALKLTFQYKNNVNATDVISTFFSYLHQSEPYNYDCKSIIKTSTIANFPQIVHTVDSLTYMINNSFTEIAPISQHKHCDSDQCSYLKQISVQGVKTSAFTFLVKSVNQLQAHTSLFMKSKKKTLELSINEIYLLCILFFTIFTTKPTNQGVINRRAVQRKLTLIAMFFLSCPFAPLQFIDEFSWLCFLLTSLTYPVGFSYYLFVLLQTLDKSIGNAKYFFDIFIISMISMLLFIERILLQHYTYSTVLLNPFLEIENFNKISQCLLLSLSVYAFLLLAKSSKSGHRYVQEKDQKLSILVIFSFALTYIIRILFYLESLSVWTFLNSSVCQASTVAALAFILIPSKEKQIQKYDEENGIQDQEHSKLTEVEILHPEKKNTIKFENEGIELQNYDSHGALEEEDSYEDELTRQAQLDQQIAEYYREDQGQIINKKQDNSSDDEIIF